MLKDLGPKALFDPGGQFLKTIPMGGTPLGNGALGARWRSSKRCGRLWMQTMKWTIFEAIVFLLALLLSVLLGKFAFHNIGWWALIPAGCFAALLIVMWLFALWNSFTLVMAQVRKLLGRVIGGISRK
jgi:hypothetical protein